MGSTQSEIYSFENPSTENIRDVRFHIKDDDVIVSYYYSTTLKRYISKHEMPVDRFHKETLKLTNKDALKMDLFTHTALNRNDCVRLAEFIWRFVK